MKSLPSASCIHTQTAEIYCTPHFIQTSFFSYPPFICAHMCIQGLHFTANSTCDKATCMTFEIQPAVLKTKPAMLLQNKNKARRSEINNPPSECHKFCWFKYNREGKKKHICSLYHYVVCVVCCMIPSKHMLSQLYCWWIFRLNVGHASSVHFTFMYHNLEKQKWAKWKNSQKILEFISHYWRHIYNKYLMFQQELHCKVTFPNESFFSIRSAKPAYNCFWSDTEVLVQKRRKKRCI